MNEEIEEKLNYCLNCVNKPCSNTGCPLNNDIPTIIRLIKEKKYEEAYDVLTQTTVLPSVCGRICPHEKQCQGSCVRGIKGNSVSIGDIETFLGDLAIERGYKIKKDEHQELKNIKIAIVGGGPAGITAAAFLAKKGAKITIYEKYNYLGGLLVHGIPEFRLPKEIVEKSISKILELGIDVIYNQEIGKNLDLEKLEKTYDKIILAFGANVSTKLGVEGEELNGVFGGNELLEYNIHPNYKNKIVVVNGGGNVAMDSARTIKKLGAEHVIVTYRRDREQMPAERKEIQDAINEGIEFLFQNNIVRIIGDKNVEQVELIKTKLIQKEGESRLSPVNIENSNYTIKADYVVMALGSHTEDFVKNLGIKLNHKGNIEVNEYEQTSNSKVYAIGDLTESKRTVAWACKSGRNVTKILQEYYKNIAII